MRDVDGLNTLIRGRKDVLFGIHINNQHVNTWKGISEAVKISNHLLSYINFYFLGRGLSMALGVAI